MMDQVRKCDGPRSFSEMPLSPTIVILSEARRAERVVDTVQIISQRSMHSTLWVLQSNTDFIYSEKNYVMTKFKFILHKNSIFLRKALLPDILQLLCSYRFP